MKKHLDEWLGPIIAVLFLFGSSTVSAEDQIVLFELDFTEDETGFFAIEDAGGGAPLGTGAWDPTFGFPEPGSLRLESDFPKDNVFALTPCIPWDNRVPYTLSADVFATREFTACQMTAQGFETSDCSGNLFGNAPVSAFPQDQWVPLEFGFSARPDARGIVARRWQVSLRGAGICHFDNIRLVRGTVNEIPALEPAGLVALLLALAAGGLLILRSR